MAIEATHLGKQSSYPQHYDPTVLVAVPRRLNREQYAISDDDLPFSGVDVWHCYEFSFLTSKGLPVAGMLKIVYPAESKYLVESKSLKLYLNSFNMHRQGENPAEGIDAVVKTIQNDLANLLKCMVEVNYFDHNAPLAISDFGHYILLEEMPGTDEIICNEYAENPKLLHPATTTGEIKWGTHLLRSNCKITHQPDWGSLYVVMEGNQLPTPESFLQYLVSLRNENHFHEEICEMVFERLTDRFSPEKLMVCCLYTRRGGIDICPVRSSNHPLPENLTHAKVKDTPAFRQ